jgi:hypothetical protein
MTSGTAMKKFQLTKDMLTVLHGTFYPTGYAFIMFPKEEQALQVANELGAAASEAMLLSPGEILHEIGKVDGEDGAALPDVGTESATVGKYINLARQGHWALMVPADDEEDVERMMVSVRKTPFSYAQKYRMLAIQDLE